MAYTRIDGELADFDRDHPWKKEYVSHMEDGIEDCESQCSELKDSLTELDIMGITGNYGTIIPANSDLNDYTTPGKYRAGNVVTAASIENSPTTTYAYVLIVIQFIQNSLVQIAFSNAASVNNIFFVRICNNNGTWGDWATIV